MTYFVVDVVVVINKAHIAHQCNAMSHPKINWSWLLFF